MESRRRRLWWQW